MVGKKPDFGLVLKVGFKNEGFELKAITLNYSDTES